MSYSKHLLIISILSVFFPFFILQGARLSPRHTSGNIVIRNNQNVSLEEAIVNIELKNLKIDEHYRSERYVKYDESFYGKFTLQNSGDLLEEIVVAYPFYEIYRDSYGFSKPGQPPVDNFEIFINGEKFDQYEIINTPGGGGYVLATYVDGTQISIDQEGVSSVTCSEDTGPFTARICRGSGDNEECENYGLYCDNLEGKYSCGTCEYTGLSAPRHRCNPLCYKIRCEEKDGFTICSECDEVDCLMPFSNNLAGKMIVMFRLDILPGQAKEIEIKYNTLGAGFVEHILQDDYSWTRPIKKEIVSFAIENGYADFVGPRKETSEALLKEVKKEDSTTTYIWEFNDFVPLEHTWKDKLYLSEYFLDFEVKKSFLSTTGLIAILSFIISVISLVIVFFLDRKHKKSLIMTEKRSDLNSPLNNCK